MAAVVAVVTDRDGERRSVSVPVQHNLRSLLSGVNQLALNAAQLLTELVEREKNPRDSARDDEEEEVSDEDDEEDNRTSDSRPPTKRFKT